MSLDVLKTHLGEVAHDLRGQGLPVPALDGKLLRPLLAYLAVPEDRRPSLSREFWSGALAVQMVHEASLLHDDILDGASLRRGRKTLVEEEGLARALVEGDHLLTASYRAAMETGSMDFARGFARGVERTVAGEKLQGALAGRVLSRADYDRVVEGKSGELFGCALALWPCISGSGDPQATFDLGVQIGRLYQMVDDFLDYCPANESGKAPLQDYGQRKWTWVLDHAPSLSFQQTPARVHQALFGGEVDGDVAMEKALVELDAFAGRLSRRCQALLGPGNGVGPVLSGWVDLARHALSIERAREVVVEEPQEDWLTYFGRHSRTFRFAARLFPPREERQVAGVYAFCRFTDDLVDAHRDRSPEELTDRLEGWRDLVQQAYSGYPTGVSLLDEVIGESAREGVPAKYPLALIDGVQMDIYPRRYRTLEELKVYSYRVASVVGLWITELYGIREPWMLQRAEALGHAMQFTNILRDVGEDWRMNRLYLPTDLLARYEVDEDSLVAMASGALPPTEGYVAVLESLMAEADRHYDLAMEAVPFLPGFYRRPVAVAARTYQGIQDRIRANGYDNWTRRAYTRFHHKAILGTRGLLEVRGGAPKGAAVPAASSAEGAQEVSP